MIREAIVTEALGWIGTPYHHRACVKGENGGVDCAMLVAGIALNVQLISQEIFDNIPTYPVQWHLHHDQGLLVPYLQSLSCQQQDQYQLGDIIVCKFGRVPSHLGVYVGDDVIVHAYRGNSIQRVVSVPFTNSILYQKMTHIFSFPGVQ